MRFHEEQGIYLDCMCSASVSGSIIEANMAGTHLEIRRM